MYTVGVALLYFSCLHHLGLGKKAATNPVVLTIDDYGQIQRETMDFSPTSGADKMAKLRQKRAIRDSASLKLKLARHREDLNFCGDRLHHATTSRGRHKRQAAGNFVVESIVILDYPLFLFWRGRNNNQRSATMQEMVDYYSNLMNSVNTRYDSVNSRGFTIHIAVNAFIIAENPSNSPWTQSLNRSNTIDANLALDNLNAFLLSSGGRIGNIPYDHAFILTGFDLVIGSQTSVAGIAQFRTCNVRSGSITEELKSQSTAAIIAHEIGHALSSRHDSDRNSCGGGSNFIMAASLGTPPRSRASNPWLFSECSKDYFSSFLASSAGSCTRTLAGSPLDLSPFLIEPFGQKYPADVQCEIHLGPGSKLCRQLYDGSTRTFDDMCRVMFCDDPNSNFCFSIPAHDGTSCGNKKWCQKGLCVVSPSAPATPENCPAGDDPDLLCTPSSCSTPVLNDFLCCGTCKPVVPVTVPVTMPVTTTAPPTQHKATASLFFTASLFQSK